MINKSIHTNVFKEIKDLIHFENLPIPTQKNRYEITIGTLRIYYSYNSMIAFEDINDRKITICENLWNKTTAKHIKEIKTIAGEHITLNRNAFLNAILLELKKQFQQIGLSLLKERFNVTIDKSNEGSTKN